MNDTTSPKAELARLRLMGVSVLVPRMQLPGAAEHSVYELGKTAADHRSGQETVSQSPSTESSREQDRMPAGAGEVPPSSGTALLPQADNREPFRAELADTAADSSDDRSASQTRATSSSREQDRMPAGAGEVPPGSGTALLPQADNREPFRAELADTAVDSNDDRSASQTRATSSSQGQDRMPAGAGEVPPSSGAALLPQADNREPFRAELADTAVDSNDDRSASQTRATSSSQGQEKVPVATGQPPEPVDYSLLISRSRELLLVDSRPAQDCDQAAWLAKFNSLARRLQLAADADEATLVKWPFGRRLRDRSAEAQAALAYLRGCLDSLAVFASEGGVRWLIIAGLNRGFELQVVEFLQQQIPATAAIQTTAISLSATLSSAQGGPQGWQENTREFWQQLAPLREQLVAAK